MVMTLVWSILALCSFVVPTFAQGGMDMSMDMSMNLATGNMLPYAHFTPGDIVWFFGWVPSTAGAMAGICIGLFMLSILERWLAACLELASQHWAERTSATITERSDGVKSPRSSPSTPKSPISPFVAEFDITRGFLFAAQKSVQILLMMAVMTFQLSFLLSISIGSGVGETMYGRFMSAHEH